MAKRIVLITAIIGLLTAVVVLITEIVKLNREFLTQTISTPTIPATSVVTQPSSSPTPKPLAQTVQWIPDNDGRGTAGLCINDNWITTPNVPICRSSSDFVPWDQLKGELQQNVLRHVIGIPSGSTLEIADYYGRRNWVVQVIGSDGNVIANVWIGNNPANNEWIYDGLVRVGYPPDTVWSTFQRYSDGSYLKQ